jgi:uridine kinase
VIVSPSNRDVLVKDKSTNQTSDLDLQVDESASLDEQIARRVHALWKRRGRTPGHILTDWLQAEREINEWHQQRLRKST